MAFLEDETVLVGKLETIPGQAAGILVADYNVLPYNVKLTQSVKEYVKKYANGRAGRSLSVKGAQSGGVSFSIDAAWSGVANQAPKWAKFSVACGCLETVYGTTGWGLTPNRSRNVKPMSFAVNFRDSETGEGIAVILVGCMGKQKFPVNENDCLRIDYDFQGIISSVSAITQAGLDAFIPTGVSTVLPQPVIGASIEVGSVRQYCSKFELDTGNGLVTLPDHGSTTGLRYTQVTTRDPKLTIDPEMRLLAAENFWTRLKDGTAATFLAETPNLKLTCPVIQLAQANPSGREGIITLEETFNVCENAGNDDWELLQGSKV